MAAPNSLPPAPIQQPLADKNGMVTSGTWSIWLQKLQTAISNAGSGSGAISVAVNGGLSLVAGVLSVLADAARGLGIDAGGVFVQLGNGLQFVGGAAAINPATAAEALAQASSSVVLTPSNLATVISEDDTLADNSNVVATSQSAVKGYVAATSVPLSDVSTDGTMAADSGTLVPSQSAVVTYVGSEVADAPYIPIADLSTDGAMAADSDSLVPSQKAVVTFIDSTLAAPGPIGGTTPGAVYASVLGVGTKSPNASALADFESTTQGILPPQMTTTQKNAISSPATGLVVFDTTLAQLCVYAGGSWVPLATGGGSVKSTLVQQQIITGSPVSTITFSGLAGIADGGYRLELALIGNAANTAIGLQINGDATSGNYVGEISGAYNATAVAAVSNPPNLVGPINTNGSLLSVVCDILIGGGLVNFQAVMRSSWTGVGEFSYVISARYTATVADITSLVLQGYTNGTTTLLANCFGVGTVVNLFRKIT